MNKMTKILWIIPLVLLSMSCKHTSKIVKTDTKELMVVPAPDTKMDEQVLSGNPAALAPAIVYKTTKNYNKNVPVILSADKKQIISYPAVSDVYYNGKLAYPTPLANGFLLDNMGINENVAFLFYTYEEYSKLAKTPSTSELYGKIIDKNPLVEIVYCTNRAGYKSIVSDLNRLIKEGFPGMKKVVLQRSE